MITPLSTTTVWSVRNRVASASKSRTPVNATGPAGTVTSDLASPGACAAIAFACASSIFDCSPAYASGSQASPKVTPKNLLFASAQIGSGEVLMPVTAQSVIVCRRRAGADLEVGQLGGARFAAGQEVERLVGPREQRLEEPRRRVDRSALRHVERRAPNSSRCRRRPGLFQRAVPPLIVKVSAASPCGVTPRIVIADGMPSAPALPLESSSNTWPRRFMLSRPMRVPSAATQHPGVAVLAAGRLDDEVPRVCRRLGQFGGRNLA